MTTLAHLMAAATFSGAAVAFGYVTVRRPEWAYRSPYDRLFFGVATIVALAALAATLLDGLNP